MKPFLKWAGGKRQHLTVLTSMAPIPAYGARYFEPFLGAGVLRPATANEVLITNFSSG